MPVHENYLQPHADALHEGRETPAEYVAECLDRVDEVDPEVRAFVEEKGRRDRVTAAVDALGDGPDGRPLYGVPVGVKDIFHVDGLPTRAGSALPPEVLAGPQAEAVTSLLEAGAVVLGKTVTTEFAYFEPGPTRNPHALDHTPGGSSSGSAAAVAAGEVPLALGSQTIGSIIRPASFCGVVGVKPTFDRIPYEGVLPLAESADHVGYFTGDVAGAQLAASVLYEEWDGTSVDGTDRPVVGVPADGYVSQAEDRAVAHFEDRLDDLREAGYEVVETDALADIEPINRRHQDLVAAEAALAHTEWYDEYGDAYGQGTIDLLEEGYEVAVERVVEARLSRWELRDALHERMVSEGIDLWLSPAAPGPAPMGIDDTGDPVMNLPWTHAGVPTVSLPAGEVDGLPMGVQVAGRFGADESLLGWARDLRGALTP